MFNLEISIAEWKKYFRGQGKTTEDDLFELEDHLRGEIAQLKHNGLDDEEAFIIAVKRIGNTYSIAQEFSKVERDNLWKQLFAPPLTREDMQNRRKEIVIVLLMAFLAGTLGKIPDILGYTLYDPADYIYLKNSPFFFFLPITIYLFWKHAPSFRYFLTIISIYCVSFLAVNFYPFTLQSNTEFLAALHLFIFLWLFTGVVYMGKDWQRNTSRMDFLRFSGEIFIYSTLIVCGGVVLFGFIQIIFMTININMQRAIEEYLLIYGIYAVPVVAVYLVEWKKNIVENIAPILAKIFSPLFLAAMLAFLFVMIGLKRSPFTERNFLIGFDIMLILVLGLVIYTISAREKHDNATHFFDYISFALVVTALILDCVALSAIIFRLSAFGISPNKIAALGENVFMLANLGGLAWLCVQFLRKKAVFISLEKWQTSYLPIYLLWPAFVVFAFPVIFNFG